MGSPIAKNSERGVGGIVQSNVVEKILCSSETPCSEAQGTGTSPQVSNAKEEGR